MRFASLLCGLVLAAGTTVPVAASEAPAAQTTQIDHILLWGRSIDQINGVMSVKLGFQVLPGRDPNGVANHFVRMPDRSYVELLGITQANPKLDPGMDSDQAVLHGGPGSRSWGLRSSALDQIRAFLQEQGFKPTQMFSASPTDPDGAGPSKPPRWRLFAFTTQPLSTTLFIIDYPPEGLKPHPAIDDKVMREHPNGAKEVSAFWLLSANADSERKQFERMGFAGSVPVRMPQVAASGFCVPVGSKRIYVLQPDGAGTAADALHSGGPQVFGVSIGVEDLALAKRRVERGYETTLANYKGLMGDSFLAPTQNDLGVWMEFHAMAADRPCG
ncbi:VOC family protein [Dyella acidisoli]|uniref:Glyoxalase-like domain-containing protein n=1 Tax=Dyella acidisoli TaxID=1867834 RepID=A0ABQ5XJC9_9GAMM|nr:VOC family protein [Dyella acidisoli]GLQ91269.1 hypothetical protein GCM10007901_02190 [Dyella acidisoli]